MGVVTPLLQKQKKISISLLFLALEFGPRRYCSTVGRTNRRGVKEPFHPKNVFTVEYIRG
jgi:hypothetical protein